MNTAASKAKGHAPELTAAKKGRGVTVVTQYGRALTFGVSRDRTEEILETIATRNHHGLSAAMQKRKAARLKIKSCAALG